MVQKVVHGLDKLAQWRKSLPNYYKVEPILPLPSTHSESPLPLLVWSPTLFLIVMPNRVVEKGQMHKFTIDNPQTKSQCQDTLISWVWVILIFRYPIFCHSNDSGEWVWSEKLGSRVGLVWKRTYHPILKKRVVATRIHTTFIRF